MAQPISDIKTYTPKAFYETSVNVDLSRYVNIGDDPIRTKGTHNEILLTQNLFNGQNPHYANVSKPVSTSV